MCEINKCCLCVKLDAGCLLIGIISFIFSISVTILSAVYLSMNIENVAKWNGTVTEEAHLQSMYTVKVKIIEHFEITLPTLQIILITSLVMGIILMISSISLLIGLSKKRSGFVLFYFGFGIFFVIFSQLGGLLMLLQKKWEFPLIIFIISMLYIHFLVVVHRVYDDISKNGSMYSSKSRQILVEEDTLSTISLDIDNESLNRF